jgi:outer membrane protein TolC
MIFRNVILYGYILISSGFLLAQSREHITLDIEQSIEIALQKNPKLLTAMRKLEESIALKGEARTGFLPKLNGTANYIKLDIAPFMPGKVFESISENFPSIPGVQELELPRRIYIGRDEIIKIGMQVQQPLFTGFQILNSYKIAKENVNVSKAQLEKERGDLIFDVQKAYWSLIKARKFVKVTQDGMKQVQGHIRDLENMYDVGMITKNDLLKTRVQLSNTKLLLIRAKNGAHMIQKVFCNTLGLSLDCSIELIEELTFMNHDIITLEDAVIQALKNRPEIKILAFGEKIGKKAIDVTTANYLPRIALLLDYNYQKPDREYNPEFYSSWTVSIVSSLNLFDWGAGKYKKHQAQYKLAQIQENLKRVKNSILLEVTQSVLMIKETKELIHVAEENVVQAEENYKVTKDLFEQGMATNSDFLDANLLLTQAKSDYITALTEFKIAEAKLERDMGVDNSVQKK